VRERELFLCRFFSNGALAVFSASRTTRAPGKSSRTPKMLTRRLREWAHPGNPTHALNSSKRNPCKNGFAPAG